MNVVEQWKQRKAGLKKKAGSVYELIFLDRTYGGVYTIKYDGDADRFILPGVGEEVSQSDKGTKRDWGMVKNDLASMMDTITKQEAEEARR